MYRVLTNILGQNRKIASAIFGFGNIFFTHRSLIVTYAVLHVSCFRNILGQNRKIASAIFGFGNFFFTHRPLIVTYAVLLVSCFQKYTWPKSRKRASCGIFSSFNLGCERKSEKCILSYGHVLSIGTSHTNLVMVFGAIPGSSDLKTGLLRLFSYFFLF